MAATLNLPKLTKEQANELGSITLAFVGDAVYSLFVRVKNSVGSTLKSGELNERTSKKVCAVAQAEFIDKLLPHLSEEEADVYRRARNAKKPSKSKHSTVAQYNKSTGFEAVIGFLYLTGNDERLDYILNFGEENDEC